MIPLLTNPPAGTQAFHVIIPSQPGFAFSEPPNSRRWKMDDTARVFDKLMTGLGYSQYAAQGGDWGSITARMLGSLHSENCTAVHLNFCPATTPGYLSFIPPKLLLRFLGWTMPSIELQRASRAVEFIEKRSAYYAIQSSTVNLASYFITHR